SLQFGPVLGGKGLGKRPRLPLMSQKGTDAGARETHQIPVRAGEFEQEDVAEERADRSGIEFAALGRGAPAAQAVPVGVERSRCGKFHQSAPARTARLGTVSSGAFPESRSRASLAAAS